MEDKNVPSRAADGLPPRSRFNSPPGKSVKQDYRRVRPRTSGDIDDAVHHRSMARNRQIAHGCRISFCWPADQS